MRKYLKPVVKEFHGDAEKYYMNLYGLLHANLLLQSFEEYTTVINILLPEIAIIFRCIIQCIARYVIHELYKRFKFSKKKKKKMTPYFHQRTSTLLQYKLDLVDT